MFQSIWDDVKREFHYGNMVTRLIIANCFVFIVMLIANLVLHIPGITQATIYDDIIHFFSMPRDGWYLLTHPWTIITSGFLHVDFGHLFWNMLSFYWFGRIVGDLLGNHRILPLYIGSVIVGNLAFFVVFNFTPYSALGGSYALGASGAVMSMLATAAFIAPDYTFNVLFIGPVKLKYIALVLFVLDLLGIANQSNTGGHFAHLGGAAFGIFFASQLRKGVDLVKPISMVIDWLTALFQGKLGERKQQFKYKRGEKEFARSEKKQTSQNKGSRRSDTEGVSDQEKLDAILDKIKQRGYDSLTKEEKEFLFNASKK